MSGSGGRRRHRKSSSRLSDGLGQNRFVIRHEQRESSSAGRAGAPQTTMRGEGRQSRSGRVGSEANAESSRPPGAFLTRISH
jgi:hypothetical protein